MPFLQCGKAAAVFVPSTSMDFAAEVWKYGSIGWICTVGQVTFKYFTPSWMDPKCSTDKYVIVLDPFHHSRCTTVFCLFFYFFSLFVYLFIYLYYVCVSWFLFYLSFSLSGLLAYVCCACHSPTHNEYWHSIVLLTTAVYTVAVCVVVLWPQSLYLWDEESPRTLAVLDVDE